MKRLINKCVKRYGPWRLIHITLAGTIVVVAVVFGVTLPGPVRPDFDTGAALTNMPPSGGEGPVRIFEPAPVDFAKLARLIRGGLFRASTPLRDKPMADKTIERIKSQLRLQCVMRIKNERVAYINIKGMGLKKCQVGDSVEGLFTVININEKSVEIKIVEHKVTLKL